MPAPAPGTARGRAGAAVADRPSSCTCSSSCRPAPCPPPPGWGPQPPPPAPPSRLSRLSPPSPAPSAHSLHYRCLHLLLVVLCMMTAIKVKIRVEIVFRTARMVKGGTRLGICYPNTFRSKLLLDRPPPGYPTLNMLTPQKLCPPSLLPGTVTLK